ncbi:unnamed protein product, partial [Iphiclides podalirius]
MLDPLARYAQSCGLLMETQSHILLAQEDECSSSLPSGEVKGAMTTQYKKFTRLIAKWPLDTTKGERDLGKFIRDKRKLSTEVAQYKDHTPVMLKEVTKHLKPADNEVYIDMTFGAGGHSRQLLTSANCKLITLDRDPTAYEKAKELAAEFPNRVLPLLGKFKDTIVKRHIAGNTINDVANPVPLRYLNPALVQDQETINQMLDSPWKAINKRVEVPSDDEVEQNPRSRSARLRAAIKIK